MSLYFIIMFTLGMVFSVYMILLGMTRLMAEQVSDNLRDDLRKEIKEALSNVK